MPRQWMAWLGVKPNLKLHFERKGYVALAQYGRDYQPSRTIIEDVFDADILQKWRKEGSQQFNLSLKFYEPEPPF